MKQVVSEANKTVITIVLVSIIGAAGFILVHIMIRQQNQNKCCMDQGGV